MEWSLLPKVLRRRRAEAHYNIEMTIREEGLSEFIYDEEKHLFGVPDGRFDFSRQHADIRLLEARGYYAMQPPVLVEEDVLWVG